MTNPLAPEIRARIDAHLDAVETQLQAAGATREKRRAVADDLETQILDMLAQTDDPATLSGVENVLNRMDPPHAYANEAAWPDNKQPMLAAAQLYRPRLCRQTKQGAWYLVAGILGQMVLISIMWAAGRALEGRLHVENVLIRDMLASPLFLLALSAVAITAGVASVVGPIVGTSCGWIATSRLRRMPQREYGLRLSMVEAVLYPFLVIWIAVYGFWSWINTVLYPKIPLDYPQRHQAIILMISCLAAAITASAGLGWLLWRITKWTTVASGGSASQTSESTTAAKAI
jgi:hypothetical protein